jgi:hypothetical protein
MKKLSKHDQVFILSYHEDDWAFLFRDFSFETFSDNLLSCYENKISNQFDNKKETYCGKTCILQPNIQ